MNSRTSLRTTRSCQPDVPFERDSHEVILAASVRTRNLGCSRAFGYAAGGGYATGWGVLDRLQPIAGAISRAIVSSIAALYSTPSWLGTVRRSVSAA